MPMSKHRAEGEARDLAAKVAHVRRAGQTRNHACHGQMPGCLGQCPPAKWGCLNCWRKLPKRLRDKIWATYRIGQEEGLAPVTREYVMVACEVQEWIEANHGGKR